MLADNSKKLLIILFIGSSHSNFNDMPLLVQRREEEDGYDCWGVFIAHGSWYLTQHMEEPDVRFNILFGDYDEVVLQEHAHPFGPVEKFCDVAVQLNEWIREAGSTLVVYECWAREAEPEVQAVMNEAHKRVIEEIGALITPVGENWCKCQESNPEMDMYYKDGAHTLVVGFDFTLKYIWQKIYANLRWKSL